MKILIVEDEPALNKSIADYLSSQQYICEVVSNFRDAREKIERHDYDCIVLDIMLPDGSGLQLLKELKAEGNSDGVIIISARNELNDKIEGLNLGADDYLTKPFHLPELSGRVAAIIRRKKLNGNNTLSFEEITIDAQARLATINGNSIMLTRKEYELLLYFVANKNKVLSKNTIAEHMWGDDMDMAENYDFIYAHIKNLRKKLLNAGATDYIKTMHGVGYKFSLR